MRLLITGPTGVVGSEAVRQSLEDPRVEHVLAVSRRPLGIEHAKLGVALLPDFKTLGSLTPDLAPIDVCFFALGVSQLQVSDPAEYREITHDYAVLTARALMAANPAARFFFVSGQGADPTMKTRMMFGRVKGETENDLRALLGERLVVFRPGYIHPVRPREKKMWQDTLSRPLILLRGVLPGLVTDSVEVARAMLQGALAADVPPLLENRDIRAAAARYVEQRAAANEAGR